MPSNQLTIAQFAQLLKQRDPRLSRFPDDLLVRKVLERRPEMVNFLQRMEARPTGPMMEKEGLQKWYEFLRDRATRNPRVEQIFRTGGPVDTFGRMITPGAKHVEVDPKEDLFYINHIKKAVRDRMSDFQK